MRAPVSELPVELEHVGVARRRGRHRARSRSRSGAGAPTVLLGPNGAGKSTLLRLAHGLMRADRRPRHMGRPRTRRASGCAMVFQRPVMLRRIAAANMSPMRCAPARDDARVTRELLAQVGPRARSPPSGAQAFRRRAAAARAGARAGRAIPRCCFSTSRPRASIPPPPRRSRTSSARSRRAASRS